MAHSLIKKLSQAHHNDVSAIQDFIAFYGLSLIAPVIWLAELTPDQRGLPFYACLILNSCFCIWRLSAICRGVLPEKGSWLTLSPLLMGWAWIGLSWAPNGLSSSSIFIFMLLTVLVLLAVLPLGSRLAFGYSIPMLLSSNLMVSHGPWENSYHITVLLNLTFFWLLVWRA